MIVVMPRVLGQDPPEVPFTVDQQVIGALAPQRSHVPLCKGIRAEHLERDLDDPRADCGEHRVERRGELGIPVPDQELVATRGRTF